MIVLLTLMFQASPHEHDAPEMGAKLHIPKSTHPVDVEPFLARKAFQRT
ncbi:MAG: hypothetical protein WC156_03590 [Pedobacter sp.]